MGVTEVLVEVAQENRSRFSKSFVIGVMGTVLELEDEFVLSGERAMFVSTFDCRLVLLEFLWIVEPAREGGDMLLNESRFETLRRFSCTP